MPIVEIKQAERSISSTGTSGYVKYRFVSLPDGAGYSRFCRPDLIRSAITKSKVGYSMRAADRNSETLVEVDLPVGTILKVVKKPVQDKTSATCYRLTEDGKWSSDGVEYIGSSKNAGDCWVCVVEIDGARHHIND